MPQTRVSFSNNRVSQNLQFLRLGQVFKITPSWGSKDQGVYQLIGYDLETKWVFLQKAIMLKDGKVTK